MQNKNGHFVRNEANLINSINDGVKFAIKPETWFNVFALKVKLKDDGEFLKVKETLTRLGIAAIGQDGGKNRLYQSCHILQKRGEYYICHFKELLLLDGKEVNMTWDDLIRRGMVVELLEKWGMVEVGKDSRDLVWKEDRDQKVSLKIIPHADKKNWQLIQKYTIGGKGGKRND